MKISLIIFFLVLPFILFGGTIKRQEVYLSKDRSKVSLINITETHSGNQTIITADTVKNLYPSENAKAYMTQEIAEVLMNESSLFWLPDSLTKQNTYLLKKNKYERYSLEVVGDKIFYYFKGYHYKPADIKRFYFFLFLSVIFVLLSLTLFTISSEKINVKLSLRWICSMGFFMFFFTFGMNETFTFIDSFFIFFVTFFPAFISTFFFKEKMKDEKLKIEIEKTNNTNLIIVKVSKEIVSEPWEYIIESVEDVDLKKFNLPEKAKLLCKKLFSIKGVFELEVHSHQVLVFKENKADWEILEPQIISVFKEIL